MGYRNKAFKSRPPARAAIKRAIDLDSEVTCRWRHSYHCDNTRADLCPNTGEMRRHRTALSCPLAPRSGQRRKHIFDLIKQRRVVYEWAIYLFGNEGFKIEPLLQWFIWMDAVEIKLFWIRSLIRNGSGWNETIKERRRKQMESYFLLVML